MNKMVDRKLKLPDGVPPLNTYYVYLTAGCNLACQHCWITPTYQAHGGTGGHLDFELFALAIEEGLPLGLSSVKLTGGEPLLHPEFIRFVDFVREKELGLVIETNGTLMTEFLAHYLKEKSTLGHISISLDGATAGTHDLFRGVKGSFDKAVQGIHYLVDAGFHPQVIMSLHAGNVSEIEDLIRFVEKLGVASVKFNLIQPSGRAKVMAKKGQTLDIHRLIEMGKWVENDLQSHTKVKLYYNWPAAFLGLKNLSTLGAYSCSIFSVLGILSTGHLAMCGIGTQVSELCYGHLGDDRVSDVWATNPMLLDLRVSIPKDFDGICGECILRNQCFGSCIAENYHSNHRLTSSFWFCNEADLAGLFPASRRKKQLPDSGDYP